MNFDLRKSTIYLILAGSRAYGTYTDSSDYDFRGIAIPPLKNYLFNKFEQSVDSNDNKFLWKNYIDLGVPQDADMQIMELTKFADLACKANPNILEILFSEKLYYKHLVMQKLLDIRDVFVTKKCRNAFIGYALSQLKRINDHREYLLHPKLVPPTRKEFDLPEKPDIDTNQFGAVIAIINREIDEILADTDDLSTSLRANLEIGMKKILALAWKEITKDRFPIGRGREYHKLDDVLFETITKRYSFDENFIEVLRKERAYRRAVNEWNAFLSWKKTRNPERAKLEEQFGIDTKHASHLLRLCYMCDDILTKGKVIVERPEAEYLKRLRNGDSIKDGTWTYEKLVEFAEAQKNRMDELWKESKLPLEPPYGKIQKVVEEMIFEFNDMKG